jgi:hypothetical protein
MSKSKKSKVEKKDVDVEKPSTKNSDPEINIPSSIENDLLKICVKIENELDEMINSNNETDDKFNKLQNYYISLSTIQDRIKLLNDKILSECQEMHQKNINTNSNENDPVNKAESDSDQDEPLRNTEKSSKPVKKQVKKVTRGKGKNVVKTDSDSD